MEWFTGHWIEILIGLVVLAIIGNAIRLIVRNRKQGKQCSCGCGSSSCAGCNKK